MCGYVFGSLDRLGGGGEWLDRWGLHIIVFCVCL